MSDNDLDLADLIKEASQNKERYIDDIVYGQGLSSPWSPKAYKYVWAKHGKILLKNRVTDVIRAINFCKWIDEPWKYISDDEDILERGTTAVGMQVRFTNGMLDDEQR